MQSVTDITRNPEVPRAILSAHPHRVGIVCQFNGWNWEAIHIITVDGHVRPLPLCFSLNYEAILVLEEAREAARELDIARLCEHGLQGPHSKRPCGCWRGGEE